MATIESPKCITTKLGPLYTAEDVRTFIKIALDRAIRDGVTPSDNTLQNVKHDIVGRCVRIAKALAARATTAEGRNAGIAVASALETYALTFGEPLPGAPDDIKLDLNRTVEPAASTPLFTGPKRAGRQTHTRSKRTDPFGLKTQIFHFWHLTSYTIDEIAQHCQCPASTVKNYLQVYKDNFPPEWSTRLFPPPEKPKPLPNVKQATKTYVKIAREHPRAASTRQYPESKYDREAFLDMFNTVRNATKVAKHFNVPVHAVNNAITKARKASDPRVLAPAI